MSKIGMGLQDSWWMFFDTFWALVIGFAISGAIQAFTSREKALASLGNHKPKTIIKASFLGAISSSCSYAASALPTTQQMALTSAQLLELLQPLLVIHY